MKITTVGFSALVAVILIGTSIAQASEITGTISSAGTLTTDVGHTSQGTILATITGGVVSNSVTATVTGGSDSSTGGSTGGGGGHPGGGRGVASSIDSSGVPGNSGNVSNSPNNGETTVINSYDIERGGGGSSDIAYASPQSQSQITGDLAINSNPSNEIAMADNQVAAASDALVGGSGSFWFWFAAILAVIAAAVVYGWMKFRGITHIR